MEDAARIAALCEQARTLLQQARDLAGDMPLGIQRNLDRALDAAREAAMLARVCAQDPAKKD